MCLVFFFIRWGTPGQIRLKIPTKKLFASCWCKFKFYSHDTIKIYFERKVWSRTVEFAPATVAPSKNVGKSRVATSQPNPPPQKWLLRRESCDTSLRHDPNPVGTRIWLRCYHPWLSLLLGATVAGPNPAVQLFLSKFSLRLTQRAFLLSPSLPLSFSPSSYFLLSPSRKRY